MENLDARTGLNPGQIAQPNLAPMRHPIAAIAAALIHIHSELCQEAVDAFTIIALIDVVGAPAGFIGNKHG